MGIAAVVFLCLAEHARLDTILVPSVGVREGILCDLAAQHFGAPGLDERRARALLDASRNLAAKFHCDMRHAEYVRAIAAILFDQLASRSTGCRRNCVCLWKWRRYCTTAAGRFTRRRITNMVNIWCRMRSCPDCPRKRRRYWRAWCAITENRSRSHITNFMRRCRRGIAGVIRELSGILRIAACDGRGRNSNVRALRIRVSRKQLRLRLFLAPGANLDLGMLRRKARPFEKEFGVRVVFTRTRAKLGASKCGTPKVHRVEVGAPQKKSRAAVPRHVWGLTA